ncbi:hypothetical protein A2U01_0053627, partial [Trifolium medium]|nr:hypothetical protein [Trifolium medium]
MNREWRAVNMEQQTNRPTAAVTAQTRRFASTEPNSEYVSQGTVLQRWQRPREGWWKCDVDGSLSQNPSATSWGWCVRNSDGFFVAV